MGDFLKNINHNNIDVDKNLIPTDTYHNYCDNIYSQNGEDGIIRQLFNELNIKSGYLCEFGAHDGVSSSNSLNILENFK